MQLKRNVKIDILYPLLLNVFGRTVVYLELLERPSLLKIILNTINVKFYEYKFLDTSD